MHKRFHLLLAINLISTISFGMSPEEKPNMRFVTSLFDAIEKKRINKAKEIVKSFKVAATLDQKDFLLILSMGLIQTSWDGLSDLSQFFIDHGTDPNVELIGHVYTPLTGAACCQKDDMVNLLLKNGADPNKRDSWGWTALCYACCKGCPNMANALLASKADPNLPTSDGRLPLYFALKERYGAHRKVRNQLTWSLLCAGAKVPDEYKSHELIVKYSELLK